MIKNHSNIPVLDSLRAFAALSVCLYHFVCTTTGFISTQWLLDLFSVGKYGVQMFFVISGFVIPWAMYHAKFEFKNLFAFILKRLIRLEPPYVFSIVVALIILWLREKLLGVHNEHIAISVSQVFLHFGYLIPFFDGYKWLNQVYWTLAIEFQYYFFIALLFIPLIKAKLIHRVFIYVSMVALCYISSQRFLPYWLPVFLIGIILFLYKAKLIKEKEYYSATILLVAFCFYKYSFVSVIYTLIPVFFVLFFEDFKVKGLHFLGKTSYSIYLIHALIGASFINVLSHSVHSPLGKFLVITGGVVITLLSAFLMFYFIEKPSKKISANIKYK